MPDRQQQTERFDEALRRIIPAGEERSYQHVLDDMKHLGYDTAGIGTWLNQFTFRGYSGAWRGAEFVTYRVPCFDRDHEGDWADGELRIVRKEAEEDA